jgi:2-hydroxychromene-2-carboxylate isomerase
VLRLTIYGDFNCPFSALASARADVLLAADAYAIDWRAIQHDTVIPAGGEPVEGDLAAALAAEVATIRDLSEQDVRLHLVVPPVRSNTAVSSAAFAAALDGADRLRRRLFAAVWAEGRNIGEAVELERLDAVGRDDVIARRWQDEFEALPQPITPTLVLPDGYISRGLGALARLANLAAAWRDPDQRGGTSGTEPTSTPTWRSELG